MKKLFSTAIIVLILAVSADITHATDEIQAKYGLIFNAGYTTVDMGDVNSFLKNVRDQWFINVCRANSTTLNLMGNALICEAAFNMEFKSIPGLSFGPKIGFIYPFTGSVAAEMSTFYCNGIYYDGSYTMTASASLIPILFGVSYDKGIAQTSFTLGCSLYLGEGLANGLWTSKTITQAPYDTATYKLWNFEVPLFGNGFMCDIQARIGFALSKSINLRLNLGYRMADIPKMFVTENVNGTFIGDISKGDVATDFNTYKSISFNFSGFISGLGLDYTF